VVVGVSTFVLYVGHRVKEIAGKAPGFFAGSYWADGLAMEFCWLEMCLRLRSLALVTSPRVQYLRLLPQYHQLGPRFAGQDCCGEVVII
jgi:hypothetical protein